MPASGIRMTAADDVLAKVLRLEQKQGCQDRAVIGGLDSFVARWCRESAESVGPERVAAVADLLAGYADQSEATRADRLARVLAAMETGGTPSESVAVPMAAVAADPVSSFAAEDLPRLADPVSRVKGIGPRMAEALGRLGLFTIHDLLFHLPSRYSRRARAPDGGPGGRFGHGGLHLLQPALPRAQLPAGCAHRRQRPAGGVQGAP
jgi:predicted flap endonuclease-1-like 5' DNA nuclease